jgi:hypothetical protein
LNLFVICTKIKGVKANIYIYIYMYFKNVRVLSSKHRSGLLSALRNSKEHSGHDAVILVWHRTCIWLQYIIVIKLSKFCADNLNDLGVMKDFLISLWYCCCFFLAHLLVLIGNLGQLKQDTAFIVRDRPFNLKGGGGGYGFLFRSEFFFWTTQELEYFFFFVVIFFSTI